MPFVDALKVTLTESKPGTMRIYLRPIEREISLRGATTDVKCLEKVFIGGEYWSPFPISPRAIVDAGANVGMATLYFAQQYPDAQIIAIEPEALNFEALERNCKGLPNVTLFKGALWSKQRDLTIVNPSAKSWAFAVADRLCEDRNSSVVPTITIPEVLDRLMVDKIDLLKLDIEGSELELFSSGSDKWLGQVRLIVIELHDRYVPGCAKAFYSAVTSQKFVQEVRGENIFVKIFSDGG